MVAILPSYPEFANLGPGHPGPRAPAASPPRRPRRRPRWWWLLTLLLLCGGIPATATRTAEPALEPCSAADPAAYLRQLHKLKAQLDHQVIQLNLLNRRLAASRPHSTATPKVVAHHLPPRLPLLVPPLRNVPIPTDPDLLVDAPRSYRGVRARHHSIDFYAPCGTPVYAALDGVVVHADQDYQELRPRFRNAMLDLSARLGDTPPTVYDLLTGRHVLLDHGCVGGHHLITAYNHLSSIRSDLKVGSVVRAGELIARVGNSGTSSAANGLRDQDCHLDFSVLIDDKPLGAGLAARDQVRLFGSLLSPIPAISAVSYRPSDSY